MSTKNFENLKIPKTFIAFCLLEIMNILKNLGNLYFLQLKTMKILKPYIMTLHLICDQTFHRPTSLPTRRSESELDLTFHTPKVGKFCRISLLLVNEGAPQTAKKQPPGKTQYPIRGGSPKPPFVFDANGRHVVGMFSFHKSF